MKTRLISGLFIAGIACLLVLPAFSKVTIEQMTTDEYMQNSGYSSTMIDMANYSKATANGEKYVSNREKQLNSYGPVTRFFHRIFSYLDPAQDEGDFMNHDVKMYPQINDL